MTAMKRRPPNVKTEWESVLAAEEGNGIIDTIIAPEKRGHIRLSEGLTSAEASVLLKIHGKNELPDKVIPKWYIFVCLFIEPMPIMIWIAIIIEAILWKWMDMSILLMIQISLFATVGL